MAENFEFSNIADVQTILKTLPLDVQKRVNRTGMNKASSRLRTMMRRDAPRITGRLRKSIVVGRSKRYPVRWVKLGLAKGETKVLSYYKLLDLKGPNRSGEYNPWFQASADRHSPAVLEIIKNSMVDAIKLEAGKAYARSKRR